MGTVNEAVYKRLYEIMGDVSALDGNPDEISDNEKKEICRRFEDNCDSNTFAGLKFCVGVKPNFWGIDQECKIRTPYDASKLFRPPVLSPEYSGL